MAEPDRLQLGKPVAAAGAAQEDRELVADQLAATVGEDRRQADLARWRLLYTFPSREAKTEIPDELRTNSISLAFHRYPY
jgi:hypothetical protein